LVPELPALYGDLNLSKLRIVRPSKVIFFCGGRIASDKQLINFIGTLAIETLSLLKRI
jgi:hypothetical protein